jgi:hypothetical protein
MVYRICNIVTRPKKKDIELNILRGVYGKKKSRKYTLSEKPDFIIHGRIDFGVEVTELYMDQTGARLHNQPGYTNDVIKGIDVHKDDADSLEVISLIEYQDKKTGKWKNLNTQGVRQENKSTPERIGIMVARINEKSEKLKHYNLQLEHIDLVIHDSRSALLDGIDDAFTRNVFANMKNWGTFKNSGYRNIYLSLPVFKAGKFEQPEVILLK